MVKIKSTTDFPTSYKWRACVTPKSRKGGSKNDLFVFLEQKSTIIELLMIPTTPLYRASSTAYVASLIRLFCRSK